MEPPVEEVSPQDRPLPEGDHLTELIRCHPTGIPVLRGTSARPLFVTAAGMPRTDAADLIRHMAGRFRLPDALRRADVLARTGGPALTQTSYPPRLIEARLAAEPCQP
jgi:endonuclease V-like protein UPF0215 family